MWMLALLIVPALFIYIFIPLSRTARYLAAFALVGACCVLLAPTIQKNYRLEKAGRQTAGVITAKHCSGGKSQRIEYKFLAESKEFRGSGAVDNNQYCATPRIGDQVFVTYLLSAPDVSVPTREVNSHIFIGILCAICMSFILIWLNAEQARSRKRREISKNAA
ncbi:hypothetical protein [Undibacterium terreum]|uniref:DUF3592 domain-containing protein n=1 Tax=Undibacterium terreum TaxID=1224302 RepID=A0A916UYS8_9BURK|nr:hypothetical protein [Undibacterium terreum]GGC95237.1 hypothetical protein GCM10011396_48240 [Undibacterium terreum]